MNRPERRYFGTDGVRGRVGETPMTPDFVLRLGWAAGTVLGRESDARVLIGKDTRRSGYLFESALEAGFAAAGAEALLLGPLPTPGVAYLTRALRADAGVVISASHNPHQDNGVKFFGPGGDKLSGELEARIEALLDQPPRCTAPERLGRARRIDDAAGRYIEFCKSCFPAQRSLAGLKLVVDCANGAAYRVAPAVFAELGAEVIAVAAEPDGFNINHDCGSTHLGALQAAVREHGADLGIALDGDGDRCLLVAADGRALDGDDLIWILARRRHRQQRLQGLVVVGTVMSNLGLERALTSLGIVFERTAVGDRYVQQRLRERGGVLGGETSGHILLLDLATTGDGIVTALQCLEAMLEAQQPLPELLQGLEKLPQVLINVPVPAPAAAWLDDPGVRRCCTHLQMRLGQSGRVLLRASGTESLVRVMVEATSAATAHSSAQELAGEVRRAAAGIGTGTA
ncbi:MAG: phosphoglucosamine mutase [Gammaproteobacteria bacterium]|nr:phosphoglucosamine mutase [Gammaproteobacteria bacterium]